MIDFERTAALGGHEFPMIISTPARPDCHPPSARGANSPRERSGPSPARTPHRFMRDCDPSSAADAMHPWPIRTEPPNPTLPAGSVDNYKSVKADNE